MGGGISLDEGAECEAKALGSCAVEDMGLAAGTVEEARIRLKPGNEFWGVELVLKKGCTTALEGYCCRMVEENLLGFESVAERPPLLISLEGAEGAKAATGT
jgi:hypothetical protein